ncbi:hypothetical protein RHDE110596_19075 [Prescottella defluvii]
MFLVPAVMKLLGDDCWWAPAWMKRIQEKIGLGEPILDDERLSGDVPELTATDTPAAPRNHEQVHAMAPAGPAQDADPLTQPIPRIATAPRARAATPRRSAARPEQPAPATTSAPGPVVAAPVPAPAPGPESRRPRPSISDDDGEVAWLSALRAPNTAAMPVVAPDAAPEPLPRPEPQPQSQARHDDEASDDDTDTGRHRRGDGVAVSVSELLARHHREDD